MTHTARHGGQPGTVYVLHVEPAYRHARHYISRAVDIDDELEDEGLEEQQVA